MFVLLFRFQPRSDQIGLDREKARVMNVSIDAIYTVMQSTFGNVYVNDFTYQGRNFRVTVQSEAKFRRTPDDLRYVYVKSNDGQLVPLSTLIKVKRVTGPELINRLNIFPAAKVMGDPAPGYSSGQAIAAMDETADAVLDKDYSLAWIGSAFQEKQTGGASSQAFIFGIIMVFLILSAQYEKWSLPMVVILSVPFAVSGALLATLLRGTQNDLYFQVGLVTLIGLAAKNAILIVEFAVMQVQAGLSYANAAIEAAKLAFPARLAHDFSGLYARRCTFGNQYRRRSCQPPCDWYRFNRRYVNVNFRCDLVCPDDVCHYRRNL